METPKWSRQKIENVVSTGLNSTSENRANKWCVAPYSGACRAADSSELHRIGAVGFVCAA
jgi:hypothetical protein